MNIGVILAGSGVYDGSEIHEAVFTLLEIDKHGGNAVCLAPNTNQLHVINHLDGEEMKETRNVLVEAARIARGKISNIENANADDLDAIVIPGGFGAAKNLNTWAINGPDSSINTHVKNLIVEMVSKGKPIVGLCMGPTVIAKALEKTNYSAKLTVGTTSEESPYDIAGINEGLEKVGSKTEMVGIDGIVYDKDNNIITAPCYMMEAGITQVHNNIQLAISKLFEVFKN